MVSLFCACTRLVEPIDTKIRVSKKDLIIQFRYPKVITNKLLNKTYKERYLTGHMTSLHLRIGKFTEDGVPRNLLIAKTLLIFLINTYSCKTYKLDRYYEKFRQSGFTANCFTRF